MVHYLQDDPQDDSKVDPIVDSQADPQADPKVDPKVEPSPVVRGHIEAIALEHPPEGKMTGGLENGAVEIATIAVTEEINPVIRTSSVRDDSLPEYLIRPSSLTDFKVMNICESQLSTHDKSDCTNGFSTLENIGNDTKSVKIGHE